MTAILLKMRSLCRLSPGEGDVPWKSPERSSACLSPLYNLKSLLKPLPREPNDLCQRPCSWDTCPLTGRRDAGELCDPLSAVCPHPAPAGTPPRLASVTYCFKGVGLLRPAGVGTMQMGWRCGMWDSVALNLLLSDLIWWHAGAPGRGYDSKDAIPDLPLCRQSRGEWVRQAAGPARCFVYITALPWTQHPCVQVAPMTQVQPRADMP